MQIVTQTLTNGRNTLSIDCETHTITVTSDDSQNIYTIENQRCWDYYCYKFRTDNNWFEYLYRLHIWEQIVKSVLIIIDMDDYKELHTLDTLDVRNLTQNDITIYGEINEYTTKMRHILSEYIKNRSVSSALSITEFYHLCYCDNHRYTYQ